MRRRKPIECNLLCVLQLTVFVSTLLAVPTTAADTKLDSQLAEAKAHEELFAQKQSERWDFTFDDGRALLRKDGTWQVEALIGHSGLRCGTYRLGVRFGAGKPGCLDVTWLNELFFATHLKHCNNADRPHQGSGFDALLSDEFARVTCAERVIKCTGLCRGRRGAEPEPIKQFGD